MGTRICSELASPKWSTGNGMARNTMTGRTLIEKYWFFIGIAVMAITAFSFPKVGAAIRTFRLLDIGIFTAFLFTGLTLETSSILRQMRDVKVLAAALFSSLLLFPAVAYGLATVVFRGMPDFAVGVLIIGVAPVTIASGTVMTAIAMGNVPLSLFICVFGNFSSILTIPILLNAILRFGGEAISMPVLQMLFSLSVKVVIPTVIGQILRPWLKEVLAPHKMKISVFNQCIVLLIILNAVASSTDRILEAGGAIGLVAGFMVFIHMLMLAVNFGISRLIRLDAASTSAFTIHTSQKTLTISYLVWSGYFAVAFPMAMIPGIAYHLTQMIADTMVANWFSGRTDRN